MLEKITDKVGLQVDVKKAISLLLQNPLDGCGDCGFDTADCICNIDPDLLSFLGADQIQEAPEPEVTYVHFHIISITDSENVL